MSYVLTGQTGMLENTSHIYENRMIALKNLIESDRDFYQSNLATAQVLTKLESGELNDSKTRATELRINIKTLKMKLVNL